MIVTQEWTHALPMMQQTTLLTAVRGPDGLPKYGCVKNILRWYRRCILLSAVDGKVLDHPAMQNGGSFTGPSYAVDVLCGPEQHGAWEPILSRQIDQYLRELDAMPHHFHLHLMHGAEILGYKHPKSSIRSWWHNVYCRFANDMHLHIELEGELDMRLGDSREGWLALADPATTA